MSGIRFEYAEIGDIKLHYATAGNGERLVILLHGFPECWYSWRHQIAALSDRYTIVAPDLRGYNLSDKPESVADYAIEKLVDDVVGLIHYFGRGEAAIVGHDWGAAVAWAVAERHPEAVWKLCAMQVPPVSVWRRNQTFKQFLASWYIFFFQIPALPELLMRRNDFALLANALKNSTAEPGIFTEADINQYKKAWREPRALTSALNYYRANILKRLFSNRPDEKIKVPTLFIYGEQDSFVLPATVRDVGSAVDAPFAEIRIPGAAHWVQQEAAEIVSDSLREFLSDSNE
jgi:pimeloyl-ACP methyl ester carboxylesterase